MSDLLFLLTALGVGRGTASGSGGGAGTENIDTNTQRDTNDPALDTNTEVI